MAIVHTRQIDTTRGRTAWLEAGAGWPVVLIHAFPLNAEMWRPQLERAPEGWRFIAPDLRGFGRADAANAGWSIDQYAADVGDFMDALRLDDAVIVGLSMGGYIAFAMYRQAPARFSGLVLADTRASADTDEGRAGRVRLRARLADGGPAAVADQMLPNLLSDGAAPSLAADVRRMIESADAAGIDAAISAMMERPDSTALLPHVTCATLVLAGERDPITPVSDAEAMQRALPRSALVVIPGAGHLSNLEQPEPFSLALIDFLRAPL